MSACTIIMLVSAFFVFYAMVGYPLLLGLLKIIQRNKKIEKNENFEPYISYMIVAHNEEKCIRQKLDNILSFDYPLNKIQVLVASDFCTDRTNEIVETFISEHRELNILLNKTKEHKGKTNAQNETQKLATGEILIMTDANSIFDKNAVRELLSSFVSDDIWYVCGQLKYQNQGNKTSENESFYWKLDLAQREIESNYQTITAGNGSIYAVRNNCFVDLKPIYCHDSQFPYLFALKKKRCLYNKDAISYEKAGETNNDEFKRKVRMNRTILEVLTNMWRPLNIFRYRWFSVFYFGHRTCRYLLWFNHIAFFIASIVFTTIDNYIVGSVIVGLQAIIMIIGIVSIKKRLTFKPLSIVGYYSMTIIAQIIAVVKQIFGLSKPVWDKAQSTR